MAMASTNTNVYKGGHATANVVIRGTGRGEKHNAEIGKKRLQKRAAEIKLKESKSKKETFRERQHNAR